jgi:hypothetical protein
LITSSSTKDYMRRQQLGYTSSLFLALSTSTRAAYAIAISSQRIFF